MHFSKKKKEKKKVSVLLRSSRKSAQRCKRDIPKKYEPHIEHLKIGRGSITISGITQN